MIKDFVDETKLIGRTVRGKLELEHPVLGRMFLDWGPTLSGTPNGAKLPRKFLNELSDGLAEKFGDLLSDRHLEEEIKKLTTQIDEWEALEDRREYTYAMTMGSLDGFTRQPPPKTLTNALEYLELKQKENLG